MNANWSFSLWNGSLSFNATRDKCSPRTHQIHKKNSESVSRVIVSEFIIASQIQTKIEQNEGKKSIDFYTCTRYCRFICRCESIIFNSRFIAFTSMKFVHAACFAIILTVKISFWFSVETINVGQKERAARIFYSFKNNDSYNKLCVPLCELNCTKKKKWEQQILDAIFGFCSPFYF